MDRLTIEENVIALDKTDSMQADKPTDTFTLTKR